MVEHDTRSGGSHPALAAKRYAPTLNQAHGLMPKSKESEHHEDSRGKKPKRNLSLLARLAQITGLALIVFALAAASDLLRDAPMTIDEFRSGMGYAYLAALSVFIAISSVARTLAEDLRNAGFLAAAALVVMIMVTGDSDPFELVSAVAGVFYVVVIRRTQAK